MSDSNAIDIHPEVTISIDHDGKKSEINGSLKPSEITLFNRSDKNEMVVNQSLVSEPTLVEPSEGLLYDIEAKPALHITVLYALQQVLLSLSGTLNMPFLITGIICAADDTLLRAQLMSTTLFMTGISTLLQSTVGTRLPIIQGASHSFVPPLVVLMTLPDFKCIENSMRNNSMLMNNNLTNNNSSSGHNMLVGDGMQLSRISRITGSLAMASLFQVILGLTGMIGFVMKFVGPLTISPCVLLISLSLIHVTADNCQDHWGIALATVFLVVLFSSYLGRFDLPFPVPKKMASCFECKSWRISKFPLFKTMSILLSIVTVWIICLVITIFGGFTSDPTKTGYYARTDVSLKAISSTAWFYIPYPGQFGLNWSVPAITGMLIATLASVVESVGDYHAAASSCLLPPPPRHAINRGIAIEGFCSIFSGVNGACHGTTSYSGNIAIIKFTKVGSRRVFQMAGLLMIFMGVFGKLGGFLSTIPKPIIGGAMMVGLGLLVSVAIGVLQKIDMSLSRNMIIFGLAIFAGNVIPGWIHKETAKGNKIIDTGIETIDQLIYMFLGTHMFLGAVTGFILDNTIPGTSKQRGLIKRKSTARLLNEKNYVEIEMMKKKQKYKSFEIPFINRIITKYKVFQYIPILQTFGEGL